jgi:hypothetical protein
MLIYVIVDLFAFLHPSESSRGSSVVIVMGYELNGRGLDPGRAMIFPFSTASRPALEPKNSPGEWQSFRGVKLTTHLHIMPRSRRVEFPLPHMS